MKSDQGWGLVRRLASAERWLAVLVTNRSDGWPGVSVVNAGLLDHPVSGEPVVALVSRGRTAKIANLRRQPQATLVFRAGWEWVAVQGGTTLIGPDDPHPDFDGDRMRQLLRDIYAAAGGVHPDLETYDRVMEAERRAAILLRPHRFIGNPAGTQHEEPR